MKVSGNDVSLAHAMASKEISESNDRIKSGLGHRIILSNSVKEFFKNVETLFRGQVVDASIGRVIGSRATAGVVVVDGDTHGNLALTQMVFNARLPPRRRVSAHTVPLIIQHHALARVMQRITGNSDINQAIKLILVHLHRALLWVVANNPLEPRTEVAVTGRGIELAGKVDEKGNLRLMTAIDAATMQSASRQAWAMSDKVEVRVVFKP